jgi:hypothetical protein
MLMPGLPSARTWLAMKMEHCNSRDSDVEFTTSNYGGTTTTPRIEWECVVSPTLPQYPGYRSPKPFQDFLTHEMGVKAGLSKEELVALRLYTGPMFMKYNCVLRRFPQGVYDALQGNNYVTTIHAAVSGIIKLASVSSLPPDRRVYRGLAGLKLPANFEEPDSFGCRGGVEAAFMSTTTKLDVALSYMAYGAKEPTMFQIDVGQVDR